jgi:sensor histidine kinase YesM
MSEPKYVVALGSCPINGGIYHDSFAVINQLNQYICANLDKKPDNSIFTMLKNISKETYLIELAKLGGLLFYVLISTFAWIINPSNETPINTILRSNLSRFIAGYIVITLLYLILNYQSKKTIVSKKAFAFLLAPGCYLLSIVWIFLWVSLNNLFESNQLSFSSIYFYKAINQLFIVIAFVGLYYLINHWINLKKQKELTLKATNLANEAQLQMLRYQINPHFLFNALNTIRSMVEEDKTIARKMITELSNFFRYSLSQTGTTDTFENEINAIKNYLEIQKIRFEEKLIIQYEIDETLCQLKIPFFIILPLVENAIKFGLQSSKIPLTIKIFAKANDHLEISVYNSGSIVENKTSREGTNTGIENTKKRLELYFPDNYSFKLFEEDSWVIAQIIIRDYKTQLA